MMTQIVLVELVGDVINVLGPDGLQTSKLQTNVYAYNPLEIKRRRSHLELKCMTAEGDIAQFCSSSITNSPE